MDPVPDQNIFPKTPPISQSQSSPNRPVLSSPHGILLGMKLGNKKTNVDDKIMTRSSSTRYYEAKKKEQLRKAIFVKQIAQHDLQEDIPMGIPIDIAADHAKKNYHQKMLEENAEKLNAAVRSGNYERQSMVDLCSKVFISKQPNDTTELTLAGNLPSTRIQQTKCEIPSQITEIVRKLPILPKRSSMSELFQDAFRKDKPMMDDPEGKPGKLSAAPIISKLHEVLIGRATGYLENTDTNIQYTDVLSNVCQLFSSFVGEKARLLRCIGFHGLCSFPIQSKLDLPFYIWILTKIDVRNSTIQLDQNRVVPIYDYDISIITGLPFKGKTVIRNEKSPLVKKTDAAVVKKFLSLGNYHSSFTVPYVEYLVTREYQSPMSKEEKYGFCVAAAVYAVSCFLAVEAGGVRFPFEILKSLLDPIEIKSHNWSQLVRKSLITQAASVQSQIGRGSKTIKVGGCPFITQVLYLDNVQFGMDIVPDYIFPRGSLYTQELLNRLIIMETKINTISNIRHYGNHEFRKQYETCYTRIADDSVGAVSGNVASMKRKRTEEETYAELVQKEIDARKKAVSLKGRPLSVGQLVLNAQQRLICSKPANHSGRCSSKQSRYCTSPANQIDLNLSLSDVANNETEGANVQHVVPILNNRIEAGIPMGTYNDPIKKCLKFYYRVNKPSLYDLSRMLWFQHLKPFPLRISGQTMMVDSSRGRQYGQDYMDALSLMLTTLDDRKYLRNRLREKHYMAYRWACAVLSPNATSDNKQYRDFFLSDFYKYDVDKCRLIVVPVDVSGNKSCYIWDFLQKKITVLDPAMMTAPLSNIQYFHEPAANFLKMRLFDCIEEFYPNWIVNRNVWTTEYKNNISKRSKWANTGLYTMLYAQFFNDGVLTVPIDTTDLVEFKARHLWELMTMPGNSGELPIHLIMTQLGGFFSLDL